MGPAAKVGELPLAVNAYRALQLLDVLAFIGVSREDGQGLLFAYLASPKGQVLLDDFCHLLLDFREIGVGNGFLAEVDVVVKALLDRRPIAE